MNTSNELTPFFSEPHFTLYHGDCLRILEQLPESSVDCIIADPPYRINIGHATWDKSEGLAKDLAFHKAWLVACRRVLKSNGSIWIFGMGASIHECAIALLELDYKPLATVIWAKPNLVYPSSSRLLTSCHEMLILAAKSSDSRYFFNYELMRDWRSDYRKVVKCEKCGETTSVELFHKTGQPMGNVWIAPSTDKREKVHGFHPTQKPLSVITKLLYASSRESDLVLDPFCGTGTTGLAAYKNGRDFIGIDFTKEYLDIVVRRFEHLKRQLSNRNEPDFKPAA